MRYWVIKLGDALVVGLALLGLCLGACVVVALGNWARIWRHGGNEFMRFWRAR